MHSRLTKNCVNAHSKVFGKGNHLFLRIPISVHVFSAGSYLCIEDCLVVDDADDAGGGDVDVDDDKENNADANDDENDTDADDADDAIYIMMQCLSVTKNEHFLERSVCLFVCL